MPRYADDFRAKAVAALKVAGFPAKRGALIAVANVLDVPAYTLRRWFRGEFNPPPETLVDEQLRDMRTLMIDEMYTVMSSLADKRDGASYRQLALSLSTYFDKLPILNDIPPKLMDAIPTLRDILHMVEFLGWSSEEFFDNMLDELHEEADRRAIAATQTPDTNLEPFAATIDPIPNFA